MIEIEEIDGGFRVVDAAKNEVTIEIDDWEPGGEELEIDYDVTETLTGSGTEIRLPNGGFAFEGAEPAESGMLNMNQRVRMNPGNHRCRIGTPITILIGLQAPGETTAENSGSGIRLSFSERTSFQLGFKEFDGFEVERIAVSPTPEGVASAIETCASMHQTERPERSFPSERPTLPTIEVRDVPEKPDVNVRGVEGPLRFRVPRSLDFLYSLAPLAFYLGAGVTVERRATPILELGSDIHEFSPSSQFSNEVASLLRRIFYLDCLVREVGPRRLGIKEFELLDNLPLDPERIYERSMLERVEAYRKVAFETIESGLPEWPLATFVESTTDNLSALSHLMDRLSLVFQPKSSPVDRRTWFERSLGDFYRSTVSATLPDELIEVHAPEAHQAMVQGWIAAGNPVDAFKCPPEAFENQRDYLVPSSEPISVSVVLNDDEMELERSRVLEIYRNRSEDLSIELDVYMEATIEELARMFESPRDFLHYIGHCDPEGFRCVDGNLSAEELSKCKTRTFFLNACGSYSEGLKLIRKGSVAGGVTLGDVLDAQAAKVGGDFARLYMHGYTIGRSLYHARGHAIMNRHYAVVGDGTHVLTQGDTILPAATHIVKVAANMFTVEYVCAPVNLNGGVLLPYAGTMPYLMGNQRRIQINRTKLQEFLTKIEHDPIIFDNKFYWPEELLEELF